MLQKQNQLAVTIKLEKNYQDVITDDDDDDDVANVVEHFDVFRITVSE